MNSMSWHYVPFKNKRGQISLHEGFFDEHGQLMFYGYNELTETFGTIQELIGTLQMMLKDAIYFSVRPFPKQGELPSDPFGLKKEVHNGQRKS